LSRSAAGVKFLKARCDRYIAWCVFGESQREAAWDWHRFSKKQHALSKQSYAMPCLSVSDRTILICAVLKKARFAEAKLECLRQMLVRTTSRSNRR